MILCPCVCVPVVRRWCDGAGLPGARATLLREQAVGRYARVCGDRRRGDGSADAAAVLRRYRLSGSMGLLRAACEHCIRPPTSPS